MTGKVVVTGATSGGGIKQNDTPLEKVRKIVKGHTLIV